MEKNNLPQKVTVIIVVSVLLILSFLIIRPVITSVLVGLILAYIFYPIYKKFYSWTKMKNFSALTICILILLIIFLLLWFLLPMTARKVIDIYLASQKIDLTESLKKILPTIFTEEFSKEFKVMFSNFITTVTTSILDYFLEYIKNFMEIILHFLLILFVFFFAMRDGSYLKEYIKAISPLNEKYEQRFINQFEGLTNSLIYGTIIIGILQGVITGIGLFIFQVPHTLLLTVVAIIFGILPIIGPTIVWVPAAIYLLYIGRTFSGVGLLIYGSVIVFWIDSLLRPLIVSKVTKIHPVVVLTGMIGGLFVFGIMGMILGPLIFSYLLLILESYKKKEISNLFARENLQ